MPKRTARDLRDRVLFQRRGPDENNDPLGPWATVASSAGDGAWSAQITRLRGGETVMAERLQGSQPVVIGVRSCAVTRLIDNAWRAVDVRSGQIYDITAASEDDTREWVDVLATAKTGNRIGV